MSTKPYSVFKQAQFPPYYGLTVEALGYLAHIPHWVVDANELFQPASPRTQISILGANGVINLQIPVKKFKKGTPTPAIQIDYIQKWQNQHWRSFQSAYGKSPFYEYYRQEVEHLFHQSPDLLIDFSLPFLKWIHSQYFPKGTFSANVACNQNLNTADDMLLLTFEMNKGKGISSRPYQQVFGREFVPRLSVLDSLFCLGPKIRN